jgi:hypothetical protein
MDSNSYFEQKRNLLKDCITLSENILSSISDMEQVNQLLEKRMEKINLLQKLDGDCGFMMDSLPGKQKTQIDQMVGLLLGLDRDAVKKIQLEQTELKKLMKINTQNQKLANYTGKHIQTSGKFLDKKK